MSDSDSSSRSKSKKEKQLNEKKKTKKSIKKKKNINNNTQIELEDISEISNLINKFNSLFIEEKTKPTAKKIIEFTKSYLFEASDNSDDCSLNYKSFIVFILKLCGLEIDIENKDEAKKFLNLQNSSFTEQEVINNLVINCKLRTIKIKLNSLSFSLNSVAEVIYNTFEIIREKEFEKFKNFLISMLKLSSNRYRKLRYVSCIILSRIFELLYNEISKTKKIVKEKSKLEEKSQNSISKGTLTLLKNKIEILNDIIILLKEKFILKKIADISKDIRLMIAETLFKISKKHFVLLFQDQKLIKFFPYFLNDPSSNIKLKYLSLLLEELSELCRDENEDDKNKEDNDDENEEDIILQSQKLINKNLKNSEEEEESLRIIVKILSVTRDAILSICIKEEKMLARTGIKIIELLSFQKILEPKTVHQLLPHLFNPESGIRTLVSRIVVSYILTFENENDDNEKHINSIKDVRYLVEFSYKLSDNENQMVEIIVDDLFNCLNIFKDFQIFFEFIEQELNSSNCQLNFIYNALLIIKYSINKIQMKIDNSMINFISINDDFINLFVKTITLYLKKFRVPLFDNSIQNNQIKILNICLELFNNLKIYKANNTLNISFDSIKDIIKELITSFFINISSFGEIEINNKDENDMFNMSYNNEIPIFEKLCNNILNAIHSILNNKELFEFFQYNHSNLIEEFIYGNDDENKESLKSKFISIIKKEVIKSKIYSKLINTNIKNLTECIDLFNINLSKKFYILFTQLNYMLIHFPKIFNEEINLIELCSVIVKILSLNLSLLPSNNKLTFHFKFNKILLTLIETLHIHLFSKEEENLSLNTSKDKNEENNNSLINYCILRNDIYNFFFSLVHMDYNEENLLYNNNILILKTKAIGIFLDSLVFVCSDNIINENLKFKVTPEIENLLTEFIRNNFIKFFLDYNKYLKNDNEIEISSNDWTQDNPKKERKSMSYVKKSIFKSECTLKTYCLKLIVEKFSRLLLSNFSTLKYVDLSCLYFETFFLIQHMHSIENVSNYTIETLMEKEIQHYIDLKNNNPNNKNFITIIIFYLTKISMKIFNEKSLLFQNEEFNLLFEEKIEMISRFLNIYSKYLKKLKNKYREDNVFDKDKMFYSNFILNGMSFALENKIPNKSDSKITDIENVYFLEIIKMFLKTNLFFNEEDIKKCIVAYLRMSKNIELTDGINIKHIKYMEKFKNYLLNKGKVVLAYKEDNDNENENKENENDDEEQNENGDIEININKESKKKKENKNKELNELEGDDDLDINLEKDEKQEEIFKNNEDEININVKEKKEKKKNKRKSNKNKKRNYNEVIKEEDENNEDDKINIKNKKMKKE